MNYIQSTLPRNNRITIELIQCHILRNAIQCNFKDAIEYILKDAIEYILRDAIECILRDAIEYIFNAKMTTEVRLGK